MKLETLAERPAKNYDLLKTVYDINGNEYKLTWDICTQTQNTYCWQKPIVISEQEYQSLQQENERLKLIEEQDKALEKDWNECREENKMLRELLNKAEEIIKPLCNSEYSYLRIASEKFLKELKEAENE